ncbi:ATP-binding protein [Microbacterium sp. zg.B48]|uniref:ATP-binding protein n=1 Tax=unclassified Microbacterium TaxID=2609290 RepID=UPI00214B143B|nr:MULTISPECIES: ATP-binding protein [unclassified Microbacterium]MCR2762699.1 ATP-binding protein [Microbacterium sp. zg.B48]MCR2808256.1 ATP-binding protein [Microbacterium sp. zg.B185]WIM19288.1 ATP-binding protein [Microbacterium sp. zg-B185]
MVTELVIGTLLESENAAPARLLASKLNRHTFWCGQSGSGKTYALGVALEQIMLHTRLPLVILDPNSDFVRMGDLRADAPAAEAEELASRDIRVRRSSADAVEPLRTRFLSMPLRSRAAILQIDPLLDAEDYNTMLRMEGDLSQVEDHDLVRFMRSHPGRVRHQLAMRLENLGVTEWQLWAWGQRSVTDDIDEQPDATVVDLGGFATQAESRAAALAVLDHLWENREQRIGRLIVIDEAHNLCTPDPATPVERLLTERIVQIAAEGRKYGLWLLLSTQRPSKVHPNALSQCDNLALLRMSSPRDLAELASVFGYAPESLLERSPGFAQGQVLFAGGFVDQPSLVQMGARLTHEGGTDVKVPLR